MKYANDTLFIDERDKIVWGLFIVVMAVIISAILYVFPKAATTDERVSESIRIERCAAMGENMPENYKYCEDMGV